MPAPQIEPEHDRQAPACPRKLFVAKALGLGQQGDDPEQAGDDGYGQTDHGGSIRASAAKENRPAETFSR
jgi:hypothetical protein